MPFLASRESLGSADGHHYVVFRDGDFIIKFDTHFGGVPTGWYPYNLFPNSVVYEHSGAGFQVTMDTGQDGTQASANGVTEHRIARINDAVTALYSFYIRETQCPLPSPVYEVTGFIPIFWMSHEAGDDSLPENSQNADQEGWKLKYHLPIVSDTEYQGAGVPIWFRGSNNSHGGIIMIGNALVKAAQPRWNDSLWEIPDGRFSCKVRVSLAQASADAFAAILFRRQVPGGPGVNMDHVYQSNGYFLTVNKLGGVEIIRSFGGVQTTPWSHTSASIGNSVSSTDGALLELRMHNQAPETVHIYVNDSKVGDYTDPNPIYGPHFGLYASTGPGTLVKFSDRQFFDVGYEIRTKYTGLAEKEIEVDISVRSLVNPPRKFYRINLVAFLAPHYRNEFNYLSADGVSRTRGDGQGGLIVQNLNNVGEMWIGNPNGLIGLRCTDVKCEIDGNPASAPHAYMDFYKPPESPPEQQGDAFLHLNALPLYMPPQSPELKSVIEARIVSRWRVQR